MQSLGLEEYMNNPLRWLALVLLDKPELPEFDDVARFIGQMYPDAPALRKRGSTDNLFTCTIGEYTAAVTLVPRPVPWSQLEGPCATAWYWPTATEALRDHQAHLLVALVDEGSKSIDKSMALTQLVSGLVGTSPVQGVFLGAGAAGASAAGVSRSGPADVAPRSAACSCGSTFASNAIPTARAGCTRRVLRP